MTNDSLNDWYANRWDCADGEIQYHAHGPEESFVVFSGPYAKNDCFIFMKAVGGKIQ